MSPIAAFFYFLLYAYVILSFYYLGSKALIGVRKNLPIPRNISNIGINDEISFKIDAVFEEIGIFKIN